MKKLAQQVAAVSALALLGTGAEAAILGATAGSEAIITFVNGNGDSISFDSGDTDVRVGDSYSLPANVVDFIAGAGGLGGVQFGIVAGNTGARNYLTTSTIDLSLSELGNSFRNSFAGSINQLIQDLNASLPPSPTAQNDSYGPFLTGSGSPNYLDAGYDTWQSGNFEFSNLGSAAGLLKLYNIQFSPGASLLGFAAISERGGMSAFVDLAGGTVSIVPVPAAVWLFGSGLGLLGLARRRVLA